MSSLKHFICLALYSTLFLSCEYKFDEAILTEVRKPDVSDLEQVIFADSFDSLYVYNRINLVFDIDLAQFELYDIFLSIDGQGHQIEQVNNQIFFLIDPDEFTNGAHTFVLKAFTTTESNSLADAVGAEYFELTKEFLVYIDKIPPEPIAIDSVYVADGTLNIKWKKPEKTNYLNLQITSKVYSNCEAPPCEFYHNIGLKNDLGKSTEFYQDFDYPGVKIAYSVDIVGYNYRVEGLKSDFEMTPFVVIAEYKDNSAIYFKWDSLLLYNNNLSIQINDGPTSKHADLVLTENGEYQDEFEIELGYFEYFYFVLDSKDNNNIYSAVSRQTERYELLLGEKFPEFREMKYAAGTNKMYTIGFYDSKLYKFDYETLMLEDSSSIVVKKLLGQEQIFLSRDGSALYYMAGQLLYQLDPNSLALLKTIDFAALVGESPEWIYLHDVSLANNHLLSFELFDSQYIFDLQKEQIVSKLPKIPDFKSILSPDGSKYIYKDSIYSIMGKELTSLGPLANTGLPRLSPIGFTQSGDEFIYYTYGSKITYVYDMNSMNLDRSFSSLSKLNLDIISNKLFSTSHEEFEHDDGKLNVYDLNGSFIRSFETYDSHTANWYFLMSGNKLFSYRGQVYQY